MAEFTQSIQKTQNLLFFLLSRQTWNWLATSSSVAVVELILMHLYIFKSA